MFNDNCTLIVTTCDKYETAWFPYFELLKIYWKDHPNIVLNTEKKQYIHKNLNIECFNGGDNITWSERLYKCLETIKTKYIIFSLEDFFLQGNVDNTVIEKCYYYMESHPDIAVCRLKATANPQLVYKKFESFYLADKNIGFRLETQAALWNKEILMSFLDFNESPWEFETYGTKRIENTDYIFLWNFNENADNIEGELIFPYIIGPKTGYGISWGKWLWNNDILFKRHNINVDFNKLGKISPAGVSLRYKILYNANTPIFIRRIYKCFIIIDTFIRLVRYLGLSKAIKKLKDI